MQKRVKAAQLTDAIEAMRKASGLTVKDFAESIGSDRSHLSNILNGRRPVSANLLAALGIEVEYLVPAEFAPKE